MDDTSFAHGPKKAGLTFHDIMVAGLKAGLGRSAASVFAVVGMWDQAKSGGIDIDGKNYRYRSSKEIAAQTGISQKTVERAVKVLIEADMVEVRLVSPNGNPWLHMRGFRLLETGQQVMSQAQSAKTPKKAKGKAQVDGPDDGNNAYSNEKDCPSQHGQNDVLKEQKNWQKLPAKEKSKEITQSGDETFSPFSHFLQEESIGALTENDLRSFYEGYSFLVSEKYDEATQVWGSKVQEWCYNFLRKVAEQKSYNSREDAVEIIRSAVDRWPYCYRLLAPLIWSKWLNEEKAFEANDHFLTTPAINGVPSYAIDQFTRSGFWVARGLLRANPDLVDLLDDAGVPPARLHKAVGDLVFLLEGSALRRRTVWSTGDLLRLPHRPLPAVFELKEALEPALALVADKAPQIAKLRRQHL